MKENILTKKIREYIRNLEVVRLSRSFDSKAKLTLNLLEENILNVETKHKKQHNTIPETDKLLYIENPGNVFGIAHQTTQYDLRKNVFELPVKDKPLNTIFKNQKYGNLKSKIPTTEDPYASNPSYRQTATTTTA